MKLEQAGSRNTFAASLAPRPLSAFKSQEARDLGQGVHSTGDFTFDSLEDDWERGCFAAKRYSLCLLDLCRRVSDHLTRPALPAVISGVSGGSLPETAIEPKRLPDYQIFEMNFSKHPFHLMLYRNGRKVCSNVRGITLLFMNGRQHLREFVCIAKWF